MKKFRIVDRLEGKTARLLALVLLVVVVVALALVMSETG